MLEQYESFIKGIIHIGANIGQEIPYYKKLNVPVLYFEPLEEIYNKLLENMIGAKNIKAEKLAVGSEDKELIIYESTKQGVSSSILKPEDHLRVFPERKFKETKCHQVKLDTYFLTNNYEYNTLVIDIQGYEYFALQGAVETLKNIDYLLLEVWYKPLYNDTPLKDEIDLFLKENFREVNHIPVNDYFGNALYERI